MLGHYYISRSWMVSTTAQWIYRRAAWFSLSLFVMVFTGTFLEGMPPFLLPLFQLALYTCVVGAAVTIVAMEYFLFSFDPSSSGRKAFWFVVMLLPFLGAAVYCLIVYSHSPDLKKKPAERPHALGEEFQGKR